MPLAFHRAGVKNVGVLTLIVTYETEFAKAFNQWDDLLSFERRFG